MKPAFYIILIIYLLAMISMTIGMLIESIDITIISGIIVVICIFIGFLSKKLNI